MNRSVKGERDLNPEHMQNREVSSQLHETLVAQARAAAKQRQAELQAVHIRKVRISTRLTRYCAVAAVMLFFLCGLGVTRMILHHPTANEIEDTPTALGECVTFRTSGVMAYPEQANQAGKAADGILYGNRWSDSPVLSEGAVSVEADKDTAWVIWIVVTGSVCLIVTAVAIGGILWKRRL